MIIIKALKVGIVVIIISLLTACTSTEVSYEFVESELLEIGSSEKELKFSFVTQDGIVHDNYRYTKDYKIKIDNEVTEPTLEYEKVFLVTKHYNWKGALTKEEVKPAQQEDSIDSNTNIRIMMNEEQYHKLFNSKSEN